MALQVLGNPPTGGREHWLGQTFEDFPTTFKGSCVRTQAQAQAAMQAGQAVIERGVTLIREAEEKRELLRPFHRRHKIERAKRDAWADVYARLEAEGWVEALSEARTSVNTARRAHAQHPGRAARVRALSLAEAAFAEMVAGEQTAQSSYDRLSALDQGQSQRVLQKAGVVIAGLAAAGTTTEMALRACLVAKGAEVEALRALTNVCATLGSEVRGTPGDGVDWNNGDTRYMFCKASIKSMQRLLGEQRRAPPPRLPLRAAFTTPCHAFTTPSCTRVRTSLHSLDDRLHGMPLVSR